MSELLKQAFAHVPFLGIMVKNPPVGRDRLVESLLIVILTTTATVQFQDKTSANVPPDIASIKASMRALQDDISIHRVECDERISTLEREAKEAVKVTKERKAKNVE